MKYHQTKSIAHRLIIANLLIVFHLVMLGADNAKPLQSQGPPLSFPGGKRGREAITALQERLPEVASRYGKGAEKLKKTVEGSWDTGISRSCVTNSIGECTVSNNRVKPSITGTSFSVTGLAKSGYTYEPDSNVEHSILVSRP